MLNHYRLEQNSKSAKEERPGSPYLDKLLEEDITFDTYQKYEGGESRFKDFQA